MNVIETLFKNLLTYGIVLSCSLTLLEYFSSRTELISYYSFINGSFILFTCLQYYKVSQLNKNDSKTFLYHSIIGGVIWVLYSIIMYILYTYNYTSKMIILITSTTFFIISILYLQLLLSNV